jgi:hypothetical protein
VHGGVRWVAGWHARGSPGLIWVLAPVDSTRRGDKMIDGVKPQCAAARSFRAVHEHAWRQEPCGSRPRHIWTLGLARMSITLLGSVVVARQGGQIGDWGQRPIAQAGQDVTGAAGQLAGYRQGRPGGG